MPIVISFILSQQNSVRSDRSSRLTGWLAGALTLWLTCYLPTTRRFEMSFDRDELRSARSANEIVFFDKRGQNSVSRTARMKMQRFSHEQSAGRSCGLMYRTIFFFTNACETRVGSPRLQTSKMRRNLTSLSTAVNTTLT